MHLTSLLKRGVAAAALAAMVTACHGGSANAPFVPSAAAPQPDAGLTPDVKSPIKLSSKSVSFPGIGTSETIVATELKYKGFLTQKNTCSKVATVTPKKAKGPKAKFKITPIAAGSCSITVRDSDKHKAVAKVRVTITNPQLSPSTLSFDQTGASAALDFTASQTGFSGAFVEKDTCSGIATVAATSWKGPSAQATVTPTAAGTCTITIDNGTGGSSAVAVTVTTSGIIIQ